jgi:hypothetical protein
MPPVRLRRAGMANAVSSHQNRLRGSHCSDWSRSWQLELTMQSPSAGTGNEIRKIGMTQQKCAVLLSVPGASV